MATPLAGRGFTFDAASRGLDQNQWKSDKAIAKTLGKIASSTRMGDDIGVPLDVIS